MSGLVKYNITHKTWNWNNYTFRNVLLHCT